MSKEREIYVSIYVASQAIVNKENLSITEYLKYFKNVMVCVFSVSRMLQSIYTNTSLSFILDIF
jgi:hypothetical protein